MLRLYDVLNRPFPPVGLLSELPVDGRSAGGAAAQSLGSPAGTHSQIPLSPGLRRALDENGGEGAARAAPHPSPAASAVATGPLGGFQGSLSASGEISTSGKLMTVLVAKRITDTDLREHRSKGIRMPTKAMVESFPDLATAR